MVSPKKRLGSEIKARCFLTTSTGGGAFRYNLLLSQKHFQYFADIIKAEKYTSLDFQLLNNQLKLRVFTFPVLTTFFETDRILRTIDLPVNYTDMDLVKLCLSDKFTDEEISFNKLDKIAKEAMRMTKADISKIFMLMSKYGFNKKEIEELILNKLRVT